MEWLHVVALASFVGVHLSVGRMRFLEGVPRARWLSFAGGVAVAYVFVHMLPELGAYQLAVARGGADAVAAGASGLYAVALAGLVTFYGLERHVRGARAGAGAGGAVRGAAFRLHAGSFALYNLLIGYLLYDRVEQGPGPLAAYAVAMSLHLLTSDFGLRLDYSTAYDRVARWVFSAALIAGAALGAVWAVPGWVLGGLFAFLAGGVALNVMKEELPEERRSRMLPFVIGAAGYAALLAWAI